MIRKALEKMLDLFIVKNDLYDKYDLVINKIYHDYYIYITIDKIDYHFIYSENLSLLGYGLINRDNKKTLNKKPVINSYLLGVVNDAINEVKNNEK